MSSCHIYTMAYVSTEIVVCQLSMHFLTRHGQALKMRPRIILVCGLRPYHLSIHVLRALMCKLLWRMLLREPILHYVTMRRPPPAPKRTVGMVVYNVK